MKVLLVRGADPNVRDNIGKSAQQWTEESPFSDVREIVMNYERDLALKDLKANDKNSGQSRLEANEQDLVARSTTGYRVPMSDIEGIFNACINDCTRIDIRNDETKRMFERCCAACKAERRSSAATQWAQLPEVKKKAVCDALSEVMRVGGDALRWEIPRRLYILRSPEFNEARLAIAASDLDEVLKEDLYRYLRSYQQRICTCVVTSFYDGCTPVMENIYRKFRQIGCRDPFSEWAEQFQKSQNKHLK